MSLADYQPARALVEFNRGSVTVRGLSLDDVSVLMHNHLPDLDGLFDLYENAATTPADTGVATTARYMVNLIREAPALVANVIALASDEPDAVENARRLPMPVQLDIMKKVVTLTFDEAGGPRKFFESLMMLLRGIRPAPQTTGSLD